MIRFQLVGVGLTLSSILGAVLGIAVWVFLPAWPRVLGVLQYNTWIALLHWAGLAMLVGFASQGIALLYGFGPSRPKVRAGSVSVSNKRLSGKEFSPVGERLEWIGSR